MTKYRMRIFRPNRPKPRLVVQKWVILAEDDAAATTLAWQRYDAFRKATTEAEEYPFGMLRAAALSFSLTDGTRLVCDSRLEGVPADATRTPRREALHLFRQPLRSLGRLMSAFRGGVSLWLSRTVKENKDKRDRMIFDMWLSCHAIDEIAAACDCGKATVSEICSGEFLKTEANKSAAAHATDFTPPIYNVWKQQEKTLVFEAGAAERFHRTGMCDRGFRFLRRRAKFVGVGQRKPHPSPS